MYFINNIISNFNIFPIVSLFILNSIFYFFHHIFLSYFYFITVTEVNYIVITHKILYSLCFVFRRPLLSSMKNIFTVPFQRNVWIATATFLSLVFGLLYLSMKWEYYQSTWKKSEAYRNQLNVGVPTVTDDLLVLLGAFAQQGNMI